MRGIDTVKQNRKNRMVVFLILLLIGCSSTNTSNFEIVEDVEIKTSDIKEYNFKDVALEEYEQIEFYGVFNKVLYFQVSLKDEHDGFAIGSTKTVYSMDLKSTKIKEEGQVGYIHRVSDIEAVNDTDFVYFLVDQDALKTPTGSYQVKYLEKGKSAKVIHDGIVFNIMNPERRFYPTSNGILFGEVDSQEINGIATSFASIFIYKIENKQAKIQWVYEEDIARDTHLTALYKPTSSTTHLTFMYDIVKVDDETQKTCVLNTYTTKMTTKDVTCGVDNLFAVDDYTILSQAGKMEIYNVNSSKVQAFKGDFNPDGKGIQVDDNKIVIREIGKKPAVFALEEKRVLRAPIASLSENDIPIFTDNEGAIYFANYEDSVNRPVLKRVNLD